MIIMMMMNRGMTRANQQWDNLETGVTEPGDQLDQALGHRQPGCLENNLMDAEAANEGRTFAPSGVNKPTKTRRTAGAAGPAVYCQGGLCQRRG